MRALTFSGMIAMRRKLVAGNWKMHGGLAQNAELLDALRLYRREWAGEKKVFRDKPLHDWTSHAADAMRYCAVMYREASGSDEPKQPPKFAIEDGQMNITLDELWAETTTREERI